MKKILVNAYLEKNLGDDLFLKILFERYSNINWGLDTSNKDYKLIFKDYKNVNIVGNLIYRIAKKIRIESMFLNQYDSIVFIGGSIFMEVKDWEKLYKYRKRLFNLLDKKEKFIIGSNFGPYYDDEFIDKNKYLFNKCIDICFRDNYSYNLFKELSNVRVAPDIVFQLRPKNINKEKDSIGISIIELDNREELKKYRLSYINKIKEIIEIGCSKNKKFTLFSFCELQGDLKIINEIVDSLNISYREKINIVSYNGNIEDFLNKFESMENIIGTRFHACILSQVFNQGLYPLIYSDKTYNVLKDIKLNKEYTYIKDIEKLNINHIFDIISNNRIIDKTIFKESEKQFDRLDYYIENI